MKHGITMTSAINGKILNQIFKECRVHTAKDY